MFQQYPQKGLNEPILLHEGRFRVQTGDHCSEPRGSAALRWLPRPEARVRSICDREKKPAIKKRLAHALRRFERASRDQDGA